MPRLITFGGLSAQNGTFVNGVVNPRSGLAILAVLAVARDRGIRREKLAAMFWPDSDEERARSALRQALFTLKRDIDAGEITVGRADLRLNSEVLSADVTDFESALREGRYEDATSLYRGPFLDGVFVQSAEFERWADEQRARLSAEFGRALEKAAAAAAARGDPRAAATWWERRAQHDPLSGRVARLYMEALVAAGEREEAIRHGSIHAQVVRQELDAEPDADVLALTARLREANGFMPVAGANVVARSGPDVKWSASSVTRVEPPSGPSGPGHKGSTAPRRLQRLIAVGGGLVVLIGVSMVVTQLRRTAPADTRRVLVVPFENRTGDSTLNDLGVVVADWLSQTLQRTGFVEVVDPVSTLKASSAGNSASGPRGPDRAATIARSAGARIVIWGDVRLAGDSLVYQAAISDVSSRTVLKSVNTVFSSRAEPLRAGNALTNAVAGALAAALDRRLASITVSSSRPPSFDAYREFIRGLEVFQGPRPRLSIPRFTVASRLDTSFAQPLIWLAFVYWNSRQLSQRDSLIDVLSRRRDQLDALERYALDYFEADRRKDLRAKLQAARAASALSPGSQWSHNTANLLLGSLQPDEALRYIRLIDPERGWVGRWFPYWKNLTVALHLTGQHAEELEASRRAQATDPDDYNFVHFEIRALIGLGKVQMAMRRIDDVMRMPPSFNSPGLMLSTIAQEMRAHGHARLADSLTDRALTWFASPEARRYTTLDFDHDEARLAMQAVRAQYEVGRWEEASKAHMLATASDGELTDELSVFGLSGSLIEARGDPQSAKRTLEEFGAAMTSAADSGPQLLAVARVAAAFGQRESAFKYLAQYIGCCSTENLAIWLHRDWEWWSLRNDPQFQALWSRRR